MMASLAIFDIDGTLCDTSAVDEECYLQACCEALGEEVRDVDWTVAPQVTDRGIVEWLWRQRHRRPPENHEVLAIKRRFLELLESERVRSPQRFRPIPGASGVFDDPRLNPWERRAATGGWEESALLKLRAAGLPTAILAASSNDSLDRVRVFRLAAERSGRPQGSVEDVVLVGDGPWDVRVARELGWRFVGVGSGEGATRLLAAGVREVVPDFTDLAAFAGALRESRIPRPEPPAGH